MAPLLMAGFVLEQALLVQPSEQERNYFSENKIELMTCSLSAVLVTKRLGGQNINIQHAGGVTLAVYKQGLENYLETSRPWVKSESHCKVKDVCLVTGIVTFGTQFISFVPEIID